MASSLHLGLPQLASDMNETGRCESVLSDASGSDHGTTRSGGSRIVRTPGKKEQHNIFGDPNQD
jgi:hypothetical protein